MTGGFEHAAARAAFDQGARARAEGRVDDAREAFLRAVAGGDPDIRAKALANLAVLEASAGRSDEARAAFEQAIATGHPEHGPQSLFNFAIFVQRGGELTRARELYEQAIASGHPEHGRKALLNLANLAANQGRLDEACGLFLRAMAPPFLGDTAWRAHRRLVEVDRGRLAAGRAVYLRAIESGDERTAAHARELLHDLDPQNSVPPRTIQIGRRTFVLSDIEDAEWAGGEPAYSSGHLDIFTRDGGQHVVFVDLNDPYDRRGYDWLRQHLGQSGR
ncbi:tetratricopeptide repeat protein [Streptomyces sp. NBC_01465]|uniref:tetratricopeptide repeat protein n=1 Tax=Streptomyces sp. NBC_01465 TaxID=2903878 RepID=UPI002E32E382|nr:tetratricopeptide repeat protein [Streptomyces sp. NBC_01465]